MKKIMITTLAVGILAFGGFAYFGGNDDPKHAEAGKNFIELNEYADEISAIVSTVGLEVEGSMNLVKGISDNEEHKGLTRVVTIGFNVKGFNEVTSDQAREVFEKVKLLFPEAEAFQFRLGFKDQEMQGHWSIHIDEVNGETKLVNWKTNEVHNY
ncbi:hypothetical protein [Ammoniphilus sp. 3BR4]|uniref:hypothetical protein n=1 Tax=Ammoniphilus sp. 3BR4 TaxID=3158265 RepID=UPI0034678FCA